jgi:hypothetical protein
MTSTLPHLTGLSNNVPVSDATHINFVLPIHQTCCNVCFVLTCMETFNYRVVNSLFLNYNSNLSLNCITTLPLSNMPAGLPLSHKSYPPLLALSLLRATIFTRTQFNRSNRWRYKPVRLYYVAHNILPASYRLSEAALEDINITQCTVRLEYWQI